MSHDCEIESQNKGGGQTWRCEENNIEVKYKIETYKEINDKARSQRKVCC